MDEKIKILLAEDDTNLGMLLKEYLRAKGFETVLCEDGEIAYERFLNEPFDICIFDVMMPKKDGFTLAKEVRQINSEIPIIFLTAKSMKEDVLEGFKLGADDYMSKPFSMEELLLRIEAVLRRSTGLKPEDEQEIFKIGKLTFNSKKQTLFDGEEEQKLTTKESELLRLLCLNENKRTKLIQAGQERLKLYSWEKAARETENVYLKTLEEHAKLSSPGKTPV